MTYATAEAIRPYLSDDALVELPEDPDKLAILLVRASRDLDLLLAPAVPDPLTGLKLDVQALTSAEMAAVVEAVAAQVEWRLLSDADRIAGIDDGLASVPGGLSFLTTPAARPPCPAAVEALAGLNFPVRSGTALPDPDPDELPADPA